MKGSSAKIETEMKFTNGSTFHLSHAKTITRPHAHKSKHLEPNSGCESCDTLTRVSDGSLSKTGPYGNSETGIRNFWTRFRIPLKPLVCGGLRKLKNSNFGVPKIPGCDM
jgi:hypothetical protein